MGDPFALQTLEQVLTELAVVMLERVWVEWFVLRAMAVALTVQVWVALALALVWVEWFALQVVEQALARSGGAVGLVQGRDVPAPAVWHWQE